VDETRYLEVFRESVAGSPWLLRLMGEPYAEKPPLLFWLARALTWVGTSQELALRSIPVLSTALTVFFVARIGRRAGLRLAGRVQAALLLPLLAGQFLLFDPLLACCVWGALLAWLSGRDRWTTLGLALGLLTKGPVALIFFVPMAWGLRPLRAASCTPRRAAAIAFCAVLPLAGWALTAAWLGGPEFAQALLWGRWAGRVTSSFAHQRPIWFYVPLAIAGALPTTFLAARGFRRATTTWERRTAWALAFQFVVFTAISGKQAHYLVPAAPALALLLAAALENERVRVRTLHLGVQVELALLAAGLVAGALALASLEGSVAVQGIEYVRSGEWLWAWSGAGLALVAGSVAAYRWRRSAAELLAVTLLSTGACLVGMQAVAGRLLFPHVLAQLLEEDPHAPLAFCGSSHHGLYALLAGDRPVTRLQESADVGPWVSAHPGGIVMLEASLLPDGPPAGLDLVARDRVHRCDVVVLRRAHDSARLDPQAGGLSRPRGAHTPG